MPRRGMIWQECVFVCCLALAGCGGGAWKVPPPVKFATKYAKMEFTFPAGWYENVKEHPFDLQCFAPTQETNTGVFAFWRSDLEEGSTPEDIFEAQIDDIQNKRNNFRELESAQKHADSNIKVTTITYRGEKDSDLNYYRFSLIEFPADANRFAVVLQVVLPEVWDKSQRDLAGIIQSARLLPDQDPAAAASGSESTLAAS